MTSNEIRSRFLDFFAAPARGHRVLHSSSLVPANDPTLLFTNAGMNQFKDVFLGRERRDYLRACSAQKCLRAGGKHNDLEQVGRTRRHHTFFEMLGNFSFGDYFKKEAIGWAWELVTQDFAIPRDRLYVTVFREDDEAEGLWAKGVGVPGTRIFRRDEQDNFWAMGETGPCGPCSEIHYDLGPEASELGHPDCKFPCDCGRYVELWNLVFMQFDRDSQGKLTPLPRPSIDTGAGLERLTAVLQGKRSNYDTDLFRPLMDEAASLARVDYGTSPDADVSLRIIADHARASTFLISDGVLPANEGRGYVLRLIIRRALYHAQTLGLSEPFLFKLSGHVVDLMKGAYPELIETAHHVAQAIKAEEDRYAHTTRVGLERLDEAPVVIRLGNDTGVEIKFREWRTQYSSHLRNLPAWIETLSRSGLSRRRGPMAPEGLAGWVPGEELFKLYDSFGLRPEFVENVVNNYGLTVDRTAYEALMHAQRERARASWKGAEKKVALPIYQRLAEQDKTAFEGYAQTTSAQCRIVALVSKGEAVQSAQAGEEIEIVLDHTPFYAEAGGQVGDVGRLLASDTTQELAHVTDTYYPVSGLIVHKAIARATLRVGEVASAEADARRRDAIRRNHTATHLLHAALRNTLGTHVKQAGSLVAPDRLRFDFNHFAGLGPQDVLDIEALVNEHILGNEEVRTEVTHLDAALASGAVALFGEKYGEWVRVVSIEDGSFSKELCGGTHVRRTGEIGLFKVISEGSISASTRRLEALTGHGVIDYLRRASQTLAQLQQSLRAKPDDLLQAAERLAESERKLRKQLESQQLKRAGGEASELVAGAKLIKGVRVVSARVEALDRGALRQMVDGLRARLGSGVIVLGSVADGKASLIAAVTKDLTNRLDAGKIVTQAAAIVDGTGGGRRDLAEAGGKNPGKLDESLRAVPAIIEKML